MKSQRVLRGLAFVLAAITLHVQAQTTGYTVTGRGADYKVLQKTTVENGTNRIHQYTELATGLNYTNASGQWVESKEQITILPQGGAAATQGRHKVYFPSDIHNGVLEVVTPDGKHLRSRPLGVSYDDGSHSVWIAKLKHCTGYLVSSNKVLYPDAFTGVKADLICTYRRGGFESDLVFRQNPPSPDAYGLDASASTLQLFTEFFNTPEPQQIPGADDPDYDISDTTLKFGKMTMMRGKAFIVGQQATNAVAVYKSWFHAEGRTFLVEQLPLEYLADDLQTLPPSTNILTAQITKDPVLYMAQVKRQFPPAREIVKDTNPMLVASVDLDKQPGVVLDYNEINTDQSGYTFQDGATYLVDGYVNLSGAVVFESGAVLKFTGNGLLDMAANSTLTFPAALTRPVEFTSYTDDSVGEIIGWSSGGPAIGDAATFLNFEALNVTIRNCRFHWADCAITGWGVRVWHSEFTDVGIAINAWDVGLYNVLLAHMGGPAIFFKNNLGADQSTILCDPFASTESSEWSISLHNSLISSSIWNSGGGVPIVITNQVFQVSESDFQNGAGQTIYGAPNSFYLNASSPYRNIGTTDLDATLLAELHQMTTYAPQDGSLPDTGLPDLGYHYPVNEDSDHDGLPDSWEWKYFGSFDQSGSGDFDGDGHDNLWEHQHASDPNKIRFRIEVATRYVNTSSTPIHLNVESGVPSSMAILVDNANYPSATWTSYNPNPTVTLGSTEGRHHVRVGLRGSASAAQQTWKEISLYLDTTPPTLTITNPAQMTTARPIIQLQGYSPEPLRAITFDVANASGSFSGKRGFVTDQHFDSSLFDFTTNFFQCYDLGLANGANTITLHASDRAGNATTKTVTLTLDIASDTTAPLIRLLWPQDGVLISGNTFYVRGKLDDETAQVTAQITDASG